MKIYTKTGDKGKTSLLGGKRARKSSLIIEAIGGIDELNAAIGYTIVEVKSSFDQTPDRQKSKLLPAVGELARVQKNLFVVGSYLAGFKNKDLGVFLKKETVSLETDIDEMTAELPVLRNFILPGGSEVAARLHLARALCRRAERAVVRSKKSNLVPYLNRLSDYLFVLARWGNWKNKVPETIWTADHDLSKRLATFERKHHRALDELAKR